MKVFSIFQTKMGQWTWVGALSVGLVLSGCKPTVDTTDAETGSNGTGTGSAVLTAKSLTTTDIGSSTATKWSSTAESGSCYSSVEVDLGAAFLAASICSGKSIFGRSGSAVCQSGSTSSAASASHILSGKETWDSSGTKITGTMANNGTWNLTQSFSTAGGAGYYSAVSNAPTASTICSSTTILGVAGSASCGGGGGSLASNACRDAGVAVVAQLAGQTTSEQITVSTETTTYAGSGATPDLPTTGGKNYRDIPDETKDDEGYTGITTKYATRPGTNCGTSGSIADRIADCVTQNGSNATWDGALNGSRGQAVWKLVARKAANKEVWQDQRTGLLWSSLVNTGGINWCQASGNKNNAPVTLYQLYNNAPGTPMTGNGTIGSISGGSSSVDEDITITFSNATTFTVSGSDCGGGSITSGSLTTTAGSTATWSRAGYCSFTITQGATNFAANDKFILKSVAAAAYSCAAGAASGFQPASPISYCAEATGLNPPAGETWTQGGYVDAKGGMGASSTDKVRWRLPTIEDYKQAEVDGIRMVMPDMGAAGSARPVPDGSSGYQNSEWSASLRSDFRGNAWVFDGDAGYVYNSPRYYTYMVRCVGR